MGPMAGRRIVWLLLYLVLELSSGADSKRHRKRPSRDEHAPAGNEMQIQFDGEGKLGLAFVKGLTPLTVRHVSAGSWAALQPDLGPGTVLLAVAGEPLPGHYKQAIELLKEATLKPVALHFWKKTTAFGRNKLEAACSSLRQKDLTAAERRLRSYVEDAPDDEPAEALLKAVSSDVRLAAAAESGAWTEQDAQLQAQTLSAYEAAAAQAAADVVASSAAVEIAALSRAMSYASAGQELHRSIRAGRRLLELASAPGALPSDQHAEAHTELAKSLITLGSVTHDHSLHTQAVGVLESAVQLSSSVDPNLAGRSSYPLAYLGFVLGQPILRDYDRCAEHLLAALDGDPTVRREHQVRHVSPICTVKWVYLPAYPPTGPARMLHAISSGTVACMGCAGR